MNTEVMLYKGYWWLPSRPDNQVAGVMNVESDGKIVLELLGALWDESLEDLFKNHHEDVILGRCYAPNNHMKDISLLNCRSSTIQNLGSSFSIIRYTCRYVLIGIHIESMDEPSFFEADVFIDELVHWCPPDNIYAVYRDDSISLNIELPKGEKPIISGVKLEDGICLNLVKTVNFDPDYPKVNIEQLTYLELKKEGISAREVIADIIKFEEFLSLATLSYTVEHKKIVLRSRLRKQELEKGEPFYHPIELVTYLYRSELPLDNNPHDYLFYYKDAETLYGKMIKRFYTEPRIRQIWNNLISSFERKRVYSSNDFLVVAQALDGFSIRFRNESGFLDQLKSLRNEFNDIDKVSLTDEDLEATKGSRHYYSHILKLEEKDKKNALDGVDLLNLTQKLRVLLICCAMNFLGFDNQKINFLLNNCSNSILRT